MENTKTTDRHEPAAHVVHEKTAASQSIVESTPRDVSNSALQSDAANDLKSSVVAMLGQIEWSDETKGFCRCPGAEQHHSTTNPKDTVIYLTGVPTISCFHSSCREQVRIANTELRKALSTGETINLSAGDLKRQNCARMERERLELKTRCAMPRILRDYHWTPDEMVKEKPFDADPQKHHRLLLQCYQEGDVIWVGERFDSGKEAHRNNFCTREEWLADKQNPKGTLTCPSTFKNNAYSRSNDNVLDQRFLVVESDLLKKEEVGAVFRWLREAVGMKLVAVVDTAGKSLHGWFKYPPIRVVDELKIMLTALQCDPGMFKKAQPARIPGALRDGKYQRLLFLDKEAAQ